uniref:Uncharacterized protein LOC111103083 n=1 Tax=Crassostrea virginica TaxID=6565 RepID=A0A8B8ANU7_CRAVI|nr:uncharacterized protein LOC111103083 [Crassostrea virginica]
MFYSKSVIMSWTYLYRANSTLPTSTSNVTPKFTQTDESAASTSTVDRESFQNNSCPAVPEPSSLLSLQISLAIFVLIAVVATAISTYLYLRLNGNKGFLFKCFTPKSTGHIVSMKVVEGTTCSADAYTDLGLENIASENENQYDPLSCQENYINVNIVV